jgi:AraC family transcriptional regulator, positive regulator of tynA and feaB
MDERETAPAAGLPQQGIDWHGLSDVTDAPGLRQTYEPPQFPGSITRAYVGELQFIGVAVRGASIVRHSRAGIARTCQTGFNLKIQLEGHCTVRQDGREARLSPGDVALCDNSRPHEVLCDAANRMLVLRIPEHLLRRQVACADQLTAVPISGSNRAAQLLGGFVRQIWSQCVEPMDPAVATHVTHAVLNLIAGAYALALPAKRGRASMSAAHRVRIRSYIEKHLADHNLTPESIAEACNIKSRYLRKLYESEHESLTRYILRRRLEECARALSSDTYRDKNVTEIAFAYGFNSVTHFGRVFRERYGVTPTEYRLRNSRQKETLDAGSGRQVDSWGRVG